MLFSSAASLALRLLLVLIVAVPHAFTWRHDGTRETPCDCYLINGTRPTYYESVFWMDFRELHQFVDEPLDIEDKDEALSTEASPSSWFHKRKWRDFFAVRPWDNSNPDGSLQGDATYLMVNSQNNVFIEESTDEDEDGDHGPRPGTWLTLQTKRLEKFQAIGEFQTKWGNFKYVSLRMLARTIGKPGAVTGMFTYRDDTGKLSDVQESDIEILTRGPQDKVQYTNQPSYTDDGDTIPQATVNASTPDWSEWAVHRLDWTPKEVLWYFNGNKTASLKFNTPKRPSDLFFSAWSDGGSWSGVMEMGDVAKLQIQWIHLLYNTTTKDVFGSDNQKKISSGNEKLNWKQRIKGAFRPKKGCRCVCSIDASDQPGKEIILVQNQATSNVSLLGSMLWLSVFTMGLFLLTSTLV